MSEDFILAVLSSVGVPAVFAGYLLHKVDNTLRELSSNVNRLVDRFDIFISSNGAGIVSIKNGGNG